MLSAMIDPDGAENKDSYLLETGRRYPVAG